MDLTIASLLDVVDRLGWIGGRTDLLTYPEYVLFKGIDMMIDEKRIWLGLKLNVYALPFNPKALIQESSVIDHEHINEEKQEENKITLIKHNTNTQRQTQEKWVKVSVKNSRYTKVKENKMKSKQQQLDKSSLTKKKTNRYQDLKEKEEEEEEIKIKEDYTVEIKTNAIGDVKEEKVVSNTYEINKMTLDEVERFCVQDAKYTPNKKKVMKREEETGFPIDKADLKVSVTSEKDNITSKSDLEIDRILYQNELMLVRLEQAELNEDAIRKRQEEKEAEWMKRMKEYEDKLAMVDLILADYDMKLEREEGGVKVYDSMYGEKDDMYESDDSSCDELVEDD